MDLNPDLPIYLTAFGITKDGRPNRDWFKESCERSNVAIAFAMEERDRELQRILDDDLDE